MVSAPVCSVLHPKRKDVSAADRPSIGSVRKCPFQQKMFGPVTCQADEIRLPTVFGSEQRAGPLQKMLATNQLRQKTDVRFQRKVAENVRFCHAGKKIVLASEVSGA